MFLVFFYIVSKEISLVNPEDDSKTKILILIISLKSYILFNKFNNSKKKCLKKIFFNSVMDLDKAEFVLGHARCSD